MAETTMLSRWIVATVMTVGAFAMPTCARADLTVFISGGFSLAYQELLPEFERATGLKVSTLSGASQGSGPNTIKAQLERGIRADVVILSREGLEELTAAGRIAEASAKGLATSPLGAAVRAGSPKPDVSTANALKEALLKARLISMPGSTSGIFIKDTVLPRLQISDKVSIKVVSRGIDSTKMLAVGGSDIALGPVSELVNQPGVEFAGTFPNELQLVQEFAAAIVKGSEQADAAQHLITFLSSKDAATAIRKAGMIPVSAN